MAKQFPIEAYLQASQPRTPDAAYISQALTTGIGAYEKQKALRTTQTLEQQKLKGGLIEKLLSAGYTPYTLDANGSKVIIETDKLLEATNTPSANIPKIMWEKEPKEKKVIPEKWQLDALSKAGLSVPAGIEVPEKWLNANVKAPVGSKSKTPGLLFNTLTGDYVDLVTKQKIDPKDTQYQDMMVGAKNWTPVDTKEIQSMVAGLPKLDQARQAANQLKDLFYDAFVPASVEENDIIGGLGQRGKGILKNIGGRIGASALTKTYNNNRAGFSGLIAKGGFGESGMLTQQDITRISALLPDAGSTKEEADRAWIEIDSILGSARNRYEQKIKSTMAGETVFTPNDNPSSISQPIKQPKNSFNSIEEAERANLPVGTEIYINGRKAVIE